MKLLVVLDELYYYDGNKYRTDSSWGKYTESFSPFFDTVTLCVPVKTGVSSNGSIEIEKVSFCALPYWDGMVNYIKNLPKNFFSIIKIANKQVKKNDIVLIRLPSLVGIVFFLFAKLYSKPVSLYIGGNIKTAANSLYSGGKILKIVTSFVANIIDSLTGLMVNHSITFVTGKELYDRFKRPKNNVFQTMTSLIRDEMIYERNDTCTREPVKIICVAQILPAKGIEYTIGAVDLLIKEGYNVSLDIVGSGEKAYYDVLVDRVKNLELDSYVNLLGYIPFGHKLFDIYKKADISVISSLSEGLPRVIIESWAMGLPVIATKVGGIPGLINNGENGVLINPGSDTEICEAIKQIINDAKLRQRIIINGTSFAKQHTSEKQAEGIIQQIFGLLEKN